MGVYNAQKKITNDGLKSREILIRRLENDCRALHKATKEKYVPVNLSMMKKIYIGNNGFETAKIRSLFCQLESSFFKILSGRMMVYSPKDLGEIIGKPERKRDWKIKNYALREKVAVRHSGRRGLAKTIRFNLCY